jgi:Cu(I)/Ag(I) efflux system membrane fusion protein
MKTTLRPILILLALAGLAAAGYAVLKFARGSGTGGQGRQVAYYQDSMHPWIKSDRPGKCTVSLMDLTPIYEGAKGFEMDASAVVLSSNSITVLNVQSEEVKRQPLSRTLRVAGTLEANESRRAILSAPAPGRIESLGVEFAGVEVKQGQPLATIVSVELIQKRAYLRAAGNQTGLTNDLARDGQRLDPFSSVLPAPISGTVVERPVVPGQYVLEGERLLTIIDSSVLWFRFDVYQNQLPWVTAGQSMRVAVEGVPGRFFPAVISFIEPTMNDATRTIKVRADIQNPVVNTNTGQRLLRFGMYADGRISAAGEEVVAVPRSAVLFPGGAAYAYVDKGDGSYGRRRLKLGRQGDDHWEVLEGLEEGERVVTSGNVLIDAQAQFSQSGEGGPEVNAAPENTGHDDPAMVARMAGPGVDQAPAMPPARADALKPAELKAVRQFLEVADGISRSLAADDPDQLKSFTGVLPDSAKSLAAALGGSPRWFEVVERLQASCQWAPGADLAAARRSFLPFSTQVVEFVQQLREREDSLRLLKVYHCPMAPKPGLWFQAKGPLRNPYFGAEMLTCGTEVKRPVAKAQPDPVMEMAVSPAANPPEPGPEPAPAKAVEPADHTAMEPAAVSEEKSPDSQGGKRRVPSRLEAAYARAAHGEQMRARRSATIAEAFAQQSGAGAATGSNAPRVLTSVRYEDLVRLSQPAQPAALQTSAPPVILAAVQPASPNHASQATPVPVKKDPPAGTPPETPRQALSAFLALAGSLSQSLAADDLAGANQCIARLPAITAPLEKGPGQDPAYADAVKRLLAIQWQPAKDLADARKQFLPFSTATVDLVKPLRKQEPDFHSLKIYHCPMAPKPGLWIQAKGPLRNPFYGSEMLECGKEVKE